MNGVLDESPPPRATMPIAHAASPLSHARSPRAARPRVARRRVRIKLGTKNKVATAVVSIDGAKQVWTYTAGNRAHGDFHAERRPVRDTAARRLADAEASTRCADGRSVAEVLASVPRHAYQVDALGAQLRAQIQADILIGDFYMRPELAADRARVAIDLEREANSAVRSFRDAMGGPREVSVVITHAAPRTYDDHDDGSPTRADAFVAALARANYRGAV